MAAQGGLMAGLGILGWIALAFGGGAYYLTGGASAFSYANFAVGAALILTALLRAAGRVRGAGAGAFRGVLLRGLGTILAVLALGVAAERLAAASQLQADWSFEGKFQPSEAVQKVIQDLCGQVHATLYYERFDPRLRSTRLLLRTLSSDGCLTYDERRLADFPDDEDRYAIASSNTVVFTLGDDYQTVGRPTEGTFYEALYRLRREDAGLVYVSRGAGEGNLMHNAGAGYSGLRETLLTEGFRLRELVVAAATEVPDDADVLLMLAPRRPLPDEALAAVDRYLEGGGSLVAFLEPGAESGLETLLGRWGMRSPDALVVDPASAPGGGVGSGVRVLAYSYGDHPVARGLDSGRMTLFPGARSFVLHKPRPQDELDTVVYASGRAWLSPAVEAAEGGSLPPRPVAATEDYQPLVVAGRYPRGDHAARIVAFGDADLASNQYLRTLYNLDLVANAMQWSVAREPALVIRPKATGASGRLQLPLPIQNTLTMFQSVGLLLPELLLMLGALAWTRTRLA